MSAGGKKGVPPHLAAAGACARNAPAPPRPARSSPHSIRQLHRPVVQVTARGRGACGPRPAGPAGSSPPALSLFWKDSASVGRGPVKSETSEAPPGLGRASHPIAGQGCRLDQTLHLLAGSAPGPGPYNPPHSGAARGRTQHTAPAAARHPPPALLSLLHPKKRTGRRDRAPPRLAPGRQAGAGGGACKGVLHCCCCCCVCVRVRG